MITMVNRKARLVGLITVVLFALVIIFALNKVISYTARPKEKVQNTNVKDDGFNLNINGNYLTYVEVDFEYKEEGAKAFIDGQDISDNIVVSYYKDGSQVSKIETDEPSTYIVNYEVANGSKHKLKRRVVIVSDSKKPNLVVPDTVTITSDEAVNYDTEDGVVATDNSGNVSFKCENTLSAIPGDYVIKCVASDSNGNEITRNRLIKVIDGIEFTYDGKLSIKYPSSKNYTYKYSLDNGKTWIDALEKENLEVKGNVIALVLENGNYKMSSTYYVK